MAVKEESERKKWIPEGWHQLSEGQSREDRLWSVTDTLKKYGATYKIIKNEGEFFVLIPQSVHEENSYYLNVTKRGVGAGRL